MTGHVRVPAAESNRTTRVRTDFLDFPTAWRIQGAGVACAPDCSAVVFNGGFLCDCGAVRAEWERLVKEGDPSDHTAI